MASIGFKLVRDDISPKLAKLAASAKHPEKVFRSMGTTFMSITMGNFNNAGAQYRPKPWAAKKDGSESKLQGKTLQLSKAFFLTVTDSSATVKSSAMSKNGFGYGLAHQFGSEKNNLQPRPFFPVGIDGKLTPAAEDLIARAGQRAIERQAGI